MNAQGTLVETLTACLAVDIVHATTWLAQVPVVGLAPGDLTGRRAVIVLAGGQTTVGALGRRLALSSAATTAVVDRLAGAGLLVRSRHPDDRRSTVIELTSAGHAAYEHVLTPLAAHVIEASDQIPGGDMGVVRTFVCALERAWGGGIRPAAGCTAAPSGASDHGRTRDGPA